MNDVIDFIHASRDRYVEELKQFLAIPSISAMPEHKDDVRRCAEWAAAEMARIGLENVRVIDTAGHPLVYADWLHAEGAPTVLFYGHYDVQPVDPLDLWKSPPFEATVRDGEIYARGASDDKGQVFVHLKAIEAHMKKTGRLPVNFKVDSRRRGRGRQREPRPLRAGARGRPGGRRGAHLRHGDVRPRRAVALLRPARPHLHADRPARHEGRPALGPVRRGGRQPGQRAGAHHRAAQGQERQHQDPRVLRRRAGAAGGGAGRVPAAALRREGREEAPGRAAAGRRARLLDARAHVGAADPGRQRPAVGLDGRRRRRPSFPPRRWPR